MFMDRYTFYEFYCALDKILVNLEFCEFGKLSRNVYCQMGE